jgi:hypothetical protein
MLSDKLYVTSIVDGKATTTEYEVVIGIEIKDDKALLHIIEKGHLSDDFWIQLLNPANLQIILQQRKQQIVGNKAPSINKRILSKDK